MRTKKKIILVTQIFLILTLYLVINTSKFDITAISLSSVNDKSFTLNTTASWSNATAISDVYGWNDDGSVYPSVAVDSSGNLHVVWQDWTDGEWGSDIEIFYVNYTASGWSNATAISDLYGWNNGDSYDPSVAVDGDGNVHVVWYDDTNGEWGTDQEIMYANYTGSGWSNATAISDLYGWNNGDSYDPSVAVDGNGNVHVVWHDATNGEWGTDLEIMYTNYTASGWSNATAISDLYGWNNGESYWPSVTVDGSGNVHVVWNDYTAGGWGGGGSDPEIFYTNYTASGWSNATAISDLYGWNNGESYRPSVAADGSGNVHVVWEDDTDGAWGTDIEIFYTKYTASGWSNPIAISDLYGWNNGESYRPSVAADGSGNVYVVWQDLTSGAWGTDDEIMYANYTAAGWSDATVISDLYGWNNDFSGGPSIAVDGTGNLHVVWHDDTDGEWGTDYEIMYTILTEKPSSSNPSDIFMLTMGSDTIDWVIWDESGIGKYRVSVYDIINKSYYLWVNWTVWTNNTNLKVPINRSVEGIFNYTIEYYDFYHQFGISDSVIVTITEYIPSKDEPIIIAPQGSGDISNFLLSPLGLGIIAGVGAMFLILVAVVIKLNNTVKELKKSSKFSTSKKSNEK